MEIDNCNSCSISKYWRPAAGFVYLIICLFDFVIAPILIPLINFKFGIGVGNWKPLSISDGVGTLHLAFGAILGAAAFGRSKEKVASIESEYDDYENDGKKVRRRTWN